MQVRKMAAATPVSWMVVLLFASAPGVSAGSDEAERMVCDAALTYDFSPGIADPHWVGTLGGCALAGATIEFWEKPDNYIVGGTEHFFEKMLITIGDDTIKGDNAGVWNFATFKFRANVLVTEATGNWAYLVGYKMHEMGYTTPFPPPEGVYQVHATAAMWLDAP